MRKNREIKTYFVQLQKYFSGEKKETFVKMPKRLQIISQKNE